MLTALAIFLSVIAIGEATYLIFAMNALADSSLAAMQRLNKRIDGR